MTTIEVVIVVMAIQLSPTAPRTISAMTSILKKGTAIAAMALSLTAKETYMVALGATTIMAPPTA